MSRVVAFNQIADQLSDYASRITRKNKLNITDEAIFAEDTAAQVLSVVFLIALSNANANKTNVAAIDLEDNDNRVKVQVTTIASGFTTKKKSTIKKFEAEPAYVAIKTLYLLFITNESLPSEVLGVEKIREGCEYIGHDLNSLLALIKPKDLRTQEQILKIVNAEFGSYVDIAEFEAPDYQDPHFYIERQFAPPGSSSSLFGYFSDTDQPKNLSEMMTEKLAAGKPLRILLRADAAMGKTQELQHLAHNLSDLSKEVLTVRIPLKNFDGDLGEYIAVYQKKWDRIKPRQLLLLFDGIDEVAIGLLEGFLRVFNQFVQAHPFTHIVATIRTIFDTAEVGAGIEDARRLQEIVLGGITEKGIHWYINKRLDQAQKLKFRQFTAQAWVTNLIYNPYYLANIADMVIAGTAELPGTRPELIAQFILLRNENDHKKYLSQIDIPGVTAFAAKLALYLVLTSSNTLNTRMLVNFTTLSTEQLKRSSLLRINAEGFDTFIGFDHNNFQEYLAALELAELTWPELNLLLFHEAMPDLLKPKMANTTNFLFSLVKTDGPIFQPLLDKLIAANTPMLYVIKSLACLPLIYFL